MERKRTTSMNDRWLKHDRISELPEPLLHHILSFLPTHEAIATAVLSNAWKHVWITSPCLDLGESLFQQKVEMKLIAGCYDFYTKETLLEQLETQFIDFVDRTLTLSRRYKSSSSSSLQRLHLFVPDKMLETSARLDWWITRAFHNYQLEQLTVNTDVSHSNVPYKFPTTAFLSSAYNSLKRLNLTGVAYRSEMMCGWLATSCPFIETLCLNYCSFYSLTIKVSGLTRLAECVIRQDKQSDKIEVCAPKLLLFECHGYASKSGCVIRLPECDNLKCLRICTSGQVWLDSDPGLFSELESLELHCSIKFKTDFVVSSNRLKSLSLGILFGHRSPSFVQFDAPNLKNFTCSALQLTSFGLKFSALEKACFHLNYDWKEVQPLDFLKKLHPCDNLEIHTKNFEELMMIQPSVRQQTSGPLSNVKHLAVMVEYCSSWSPIKDSIDEIVDNLLWLCPHPQSITMALHRSSYKLKEIKVLKFKYKEDKKGTKNYDCCNFLPNPCWQHDLAEVSIENSKGVDVNLKNYQRRHKTRAIVDDKIKAFFKNAVKGKKITVKVTNLTSVSSTAHL